jgi:hypothetical protein
MPGLNDVGKMLFVSSLPSWDYVANWYYDLARTKTRTTFEIEDVVADLFEGKANLSEEERVRTIYDFITENIRYSSVSFRQSAYIPRRARDVLVHRLGDCKDVATLCIAMLNEVGIKAHYVLVNTWNDGLNRNIPPSIAFNHCVVGVSMKGGIKYVDLTAANFPSGSIPPVVNGAFALAINGGWRDPMYLESSQFSSNSLFRTSTAVLKEDNTMSLVCLSRRSGAKSANLRARYRNKSDTERMKLLGEILSNDYPNVRVTALTVNNIDALDPVLEDGHTYTVPQFLSDAGGFKLLRIPWSDKLEPIEALSYESRVYPYVIGVANDTLIETIRVELPKGYTLHEVPKPLALSNAAGEYAVMYELKKREIIAKRTLIFKKPSIAPEEYLSFKQFYNEALREDNRQLLLKK